MIPCIKKLRLNELKIVSIPRNRDYFLRGGYVGVASSSFTGDEVAPTVGSKLSDLALMDEFDRQRLIEESNREDGAFPMSV